jgi:hypothetical protein
MSELYLWLFLSALVLGVLWGVYKLIKDNGALEKDVDNLEKVVKERNNNIEFLNDIKKQSEVTSNLSDDELNNGLR